LDKKKKNNNQKKKKKGTEPKIEKREAKKQKTKKQDM